MKNADNHKATSERAALAAGPADSPSALHLSFADVSGGRPGQEAGRAHRFHMEVAPQTKFIRDAGHRNGRPRLPRARRKSFAQTNLTRHFYGNLTMSTSIRTIQLITHEAAQRAVQAAVAEAAAKGVAISVAVFNGLMVQVAYLHADGATPHSAETSRRKAQTAASTRRPTGWMGPDLAITLPLASGNLLTNVGGGMPIRFSGVFVGAIGVAGGTVEEDIGIAKAACLAIGADPIE